MTPEQKLARSARMKKWRSENPEKLKEHSAKRRRDPRKRKDIFFRSFYGISLKQFEERLRKQNNSCAICRREFEGSGSRANAPAVDHDHKNGKFRGILHNNCNKGIGVFSEDPDALRAAADYIEHNRVFDEQEHSLVEH